MNVYKPNSNDSNILDETVREKTAKAQINEFLTQQFIELTRGHSNSDRQRVRDSIRRLKLRFLGNPKMELDYELFEQYDVMNLLFYYTTLPLTNTKDNYFAYNTMKEAQNEASKLISLIFEFQKFENIKDFLDSFDFKERIINLFSMHTVSFAQIAIQLLNSLLNNNYHEIEIYIFDIMNLEELFNYTVELLNNLKEIQKENIHKKDCETMIVSESPSEYLYQYGLFFYLISLRTLDDEDFVKYLLKYTFESHNILKTEYHQADSYLLWALKCVGGRYTDLVMERTATPDFLLDLYQKCKYPYHDVAKASIVFLYFMFTHNLDPKLLDLNIFLELLENRITGKDVLQPLFISLKAVISFIGVGHDFLIRLVYLLNIYLEEINYSTICLIMPVIISIINTGQLNLDELLDSKNLNLFEWISKYGDSEDTEFMNECIKCVDYVFSLAVKNNVLEDVKDLFINEGLDDVFDTMEETYNNEEFSTKLDMFKSTYFPAE